MSVNQWGAVNQWGSVSNNYSLLVESLSYSLSSYSELSLLIGRHLPLQTVNYGFQFNDLTLYKYSSLSVDNSSYSILYENIPITVSGINNNYNLNVDSFVFTLSFSNSVTMLLDRSLGFNSFEYGLQVYPIILNYSGASLSLVDTYTLYYRNEKTLNIQYYS